MVPPSQKKAAPKRRKARIAPKTAAVTITALGGQSYAEILKTARERVDLEDIGVSSTMALKRARNGGYLLEIKGEGGSDKANRLARDLEDTLSGDALVARPVKYAEMRVIGLDELVSPEEIERAICAQGECARSSLRVGNIRRAPNELGALQFRCPLAAVLERQEEVVIEIGDPTQIPPDLRLDDWGYSYSP